jgi:hypothetical protein
MKLETKTRLRELTSKYFLLRRGRAHKKSIHDEICKLVAPLLPEFIRGDDREEVAEEVVCKAIGMMRLLPPTRVAPFSWTYMLRSLAFVGVMEMIELERTKEPRVFTKETRNVRINDDRNNFDELKRQKKKLEEWEESTSTCRKEMQDMCGDESTQEMWHDLMPIEAYLFGQKISEEYVHNRFLEDTVVACETFWNALTRDLSMVNDRLAGFKSDISSKGGWSEPSRRRIRFILRHCDLNHIPLHKMASRMACVLYEAKVVPIRFKKRDLPPSHIIERLTDQILKIYQRDPTRPHLIQD